MWEGAMPTYRVYVVSTDDHIKEPAHLLECADDQEAIGQAVQYTNDHTVYGKVLGWSGSSPRSVSQLQDFSD